MRNLNSNKNFTKVSTSIICLDKYKQRLIDARKSDIKIIPQEQKMT